MKKSEKTISESIPDFLDYCEVERGLSSKTQENYSHYLNKLLEWLKAKNKLNLLPHEFTAQDVWDYRLYLSRYQSKPKNGLRAVQARLPARQGLSKLTQNYYLIALRALLGYFVAKDIVSLPPDKVTLPKDADKEKTIKFLNLEQVQKLLDVADPESPSDLSRLRDRTILESLFSTGLRVAELVALNKEQFDSIWDKTDFELGVIGKGSRPRTVYFSERALEWLKKYLKTRSDKQKALFINYRGRLPQRQSAEEAENRLTSRSIERMIKHYAIKAGIPLSTTPHTLRHSYATDLLEQGVDLRTIQEFLGHKNIVTTQIYTHVTNKRLRDVHKQFHSLGKSRE